jgi:transcription-repair coupling factor (superfamily II helicase)
MKLNDILKPENLKEYDALLAALNAGAAVSAVALAPKISHFAGCTGGKVLFVAPDTVAAKQFFAAITQYAGEDNTAYLPPIDDILLYKKAFNPTNSHLRLNALYKIVSPAPAVVVTSLESLTQNFLDAEVFKGNIKTIKPNDKINLNGLIKYLAACGYDREDLISGEGQFSVRGDIVDIFSVNYKNPVRIDLFGNVVESVKFFDIESQKSLFKTDAVDIIPATDMSAADRTDVYAADYAPDRDYTGDRTERAAIYTGGSAYDTADLDRAGGNAPDRVRAAASAHSPVKDFLPPDSLIIFNEPRLMEQRLVNIYKEHTARLAQIGVAEQKTASSLIRNKNDVFKGLERFKRLSFSRLAQASSASADIFFAPRGGEVFTFNTTPIFKYSADFGQLVVDLKNWIKNGYTVYCCAGSEDAAHGLYNNLFENNVPVARAAEDSVTLKNCALILTRRIDGGFILHKDKTVLIGTDELFKKSAPKPFLGKKKTDVFTEFKAGDYVVHDSFGIGKCEGIQKLGATDAGKDYIVVGYKDDDMLYVPCEQSNLLHRYSGGESPRLSRIGGAEFEKIKQRVSADIKAMSFGLLELYKNRQESKGFRFSPDSALSADFENKFQFAETDDQLKCIAEIKKDMESDTVMDRLLCGDVGYGKTEVALRAAFKAVCDGKQVAFLCPTTILTSQHYNTCLERFKDFGVRIDFLSRFKNEAAQHDTIKKIAEGGIDIICGTHRLLSADVKFCDLGLLILDEEQRFGVEDKEKIKLLKNNVDVLTLSATPIPRTLYMSLAGIRDISVIETPPQNRLTVETYVAEYDDGLVTEAISRELSRGGQVFLVYNRVNGIESFAAKMRLLLPTARICVAHGQMDENVLEENIIDFYDYKADILVCTTIIENGIDLKRANTLIVADADRLGLSQLYQLRGRVGRSNRLAYAYFLYKRDKTLSDTAYKRLNAIMEFTEFGSGFKIAMRDLEIRGAGSILGREQHGHMEKVGYDIYCRLLRECADEQSGGKRRARTEPFMDIEIDAFIPDGYIKEDIKIRAYQKIASIERAREREEILAELNDVYGAVPKSVDNLLNVAVIKLLAGGILAVRVTVKAGVLELLFGGISDLNNEGLMRAVKKYEKLCAFDLSAAMPRLVFKSRNADVERNMQLLEEFLMIAEGEHGTEGADGESDER